MRFGRIIAAAIHAAQQRSRWDHRKHTFAKPKELVEAYAGGFIGAADCPEIDEAFGSWSPFPVAEDAAHQFGLAESGKGKLILPFLHIQELFKGRGDPLPGPAQGRGDCVSHSTKNAKLLTMCCEVAAGKPDEVTGLLEGIPEIPDEAVSQGVLSTEANYWWRRHGGDGWSCGHSARVAVEESGVWPRKNYPEFGFDLTRYSSSLAGRWGRTAPPNTVKQHGLKNAIRSATRASLADAIRDFLANGYGPTTCGGEGFSSVRDENGVSSRRGSWAHAMAYIGFDDRDEMKRLYSGPLVLVQNSWGRWNSGPRRIRGTNIEIPHGSFWARWQDVSRRSVYFLSGLNGFPAQKLPDWGGTEIFN